ncbi:MAG TPA: hypothetical protein VG734_23420, partial [Lacunisphaera sp.]|nr:hypothetical protein [Lacunisphaera sp.]
MLLRHAWPAGLDSQWSTLSTRDKAQVLEYFQKHGWQAIYLVTYSGAIGESAWRNIYAEERQALMKAKYAAFTDSLSPDQKRIWKSGALNRTVHIADGRPDYARNHNPPDEQAIFAA